VSDRFWPRPTELPRDLGAGVTIALVSIAEGMAYAVVAGVNPVYGLYAGSVSVIVGSLLASSTLLIVTATNALALVAADQIGALGKDVDPATALFTLTLLVGIVMAGLGLARLGSVVRFISAEIQAGLVAAVALLIVLGQYDELVGYPSTTTVAGGGKVVKAFDISLHLPTWDGPTAAVGGLCIAALLIAKRSRLRPFADIVAMVLGVTVVAGLVWTRWRPSGTSQPSPPAWTRSPPRTCRTCPWCLPSSLPRSPPRSSGSPRRRRSAPRTRIRPEPGRT
jgi:SulP family sulfate permease